MGELKLLLDTHTLLWWWSQPERLSPRALALLRDAGNAIHVSAASAWEISTKVRIGKLPAGYRILEQWDQRLAEDGFRELGISASHAWRAGLLPGEHRDPFDRMLAAQSLLEGWPLLGCDGALAGLGAELWW